MHFILALLALSPLAYSSPISPEAANAGAQPQVLAAQSPEAVGKPSSEGKTTFDGVALSSIKAAPAPEAVADAAIGRDGWTCDVDSAQAENPCTNVLDGDAGTIWHTQFNPTTDDLPHTITINMQAVHLVGSIIIQPRGDNGNGNIGEHIISLSTNGADYQHVGYGTYIDNQNVKTTTITPQNAQYVRIQALTEAGGRGPWTSIAEVNIGDAAGGPPGPAGKGAWGPTVDFPLVPVSMANQVNGDILAWSSYDPATFGNSNGVQTITASYSPGSQTVTSALITNTQHDMFCEGLSIDFNGRFLAAGGNTASAVSIFDGGAWTKGNTLQIARGYQAQATLSNGYTFTIGASWSGGQGGKNGEVYDGNAWRGLGGAPVAPMLTADAQEHYVFQAGPSVAMNWYGTDGDGSQAGAGDRTGDGDAMCGIAAMYDAPNGKILTAGGSPSYQDSDATSNAHIITLGDPDTNPGVQTIANMAFQRAFACSVILPTGQVFIVGGQVHAVPFSDDTSQLTPEIFDPADNSFTQVAPMASPRNYHSTAVLLADGTVLSGGGGLCGDCATNHFDAQVYRPPYLYDGGGGDAPRPAITAVSTNTVVVGGTFTCTTGGPVDGGFSLLRLSSTTHTVNTDQRRIPLTPSGNDGNTYTLTLPGDPGVCLAGYWFLFALDGGVPSTAQTIKITPD
ncbi:uncharacterized protein KY384_005332 [Bacidia gigantensis]|uniref:uncharacterized protein n=1 Tax=Bacidia gigantensis TaxID=2732470 RepID=UPI001D05A13E|nr:uncharacterized protein KY384_005332 [Bacidia gigantensis]KAG8529851.1 hypothetical protein KY384_005332 [Bacidia gigantensis]